MSLDPGRGEARFALAQLYEKEGKTQEAIREYERLIQLAPYHLRVADARKRLKVVRK